MKKPTSFVSEHTCEYYLLAELVPFLSQYFEKVTPFFYWATREGSFRNNYQTSAYQCLVIYPRRPKIINPFTREALVKFNESIFPVVQFYKSEGLPVIAGSPSVFSIFDFQWQNPSNYWFEFTGHSDSDLEYLITDSIVKSTDENIVRYIHTERVIELLNHSKPMFWNELIKVITTARHLDHRRFSWYFNNYKPIFILLSNGKN